LLTIIAREEIKKAFAAPKIQKEKMDTLTENLYKLFHTDNLPTLLRNYDHYSMANGVEVRSPFLDHRLVSYTFSLPWQSKLSKGLTKTILRDAMLPYLPKAIYNRRSKMGFQTPIVDWLKGPWKHYFLELIHSDRFNQSTFIEANTVRQNIENCINNKDVSYRDGELAYTSIAPFLWELFVLEKFKQIHIQFRNTKTEF
jgi:asparagine synthase (glutamine-hydrolysing)